MKSPVDLAVLTALHREHVAWLEREYANILGRAGLDAVVIHSGSPKSRSVFDDQYWPLRATPHFQHWLPLVTPHSALVVESGKRPKLVWNRELGFWEGPAEPETPHFWGAFDVAEIRDASRVKEHLPLARRTAFVGEDREEAAAWGFAPERIVPAALLAELDRLRIWKTPYEVLCLREANRRAALGHSRVIEAFLGGDHSELDLHLLFLGATEQDDPETPYKNIVALGHHAATLHHVSYSRAANAAESLLLDAGARYQGYDSDVTRTAVKGKGAAADSFRELVAGMEAMQQELCRRVRLGLPYQDLHNQSHELLAPLLRHVGIARASDSELVDSGITRLFLPHGLGHSLGLQTHDVGCRSVVPESRNPFLRNTTPVSARQVFTIEPGCYFIDSLLDEWRAKPAGRSIDWAVVDQLRPFGGVRIEDDVAVIETGIDNLTRGYLA